MSTKLASNNTKPVEFPSTYNAAYERIVKLRDDIFADKHPKLKPFKRAVPVTQLPVSAPSLPVPAIKNGTSSPTIKALTQKDGPGKATQTGVASATASDAPPMTSSGPASGIHPIFLTKSDVLVRAELQQKRQRLERSLDEQLSQKRAIARQNVLEEYALPEFNVTEVFRKAQEIVKPIRLTVRNAANRVTSSSDSFDENTFYSSQMNTTSEETDAPANHLLQVEAQEGGPQPMDIDSGNDADEQTSSRSQGRAEPVTAKVPESHAEQIARLEEELRLLKSAEKPTQRRMTPPITREAEIPDEPPYSPPDVRAPSLVSGTNNVSAGEIGRAQPPEPAPRRSSRALESQSREYARRNDLAEEPATNDMRIVRNHITSPLAPQPARVSPLAVTKGPAVSQVRNNKQQNKKSGPSLGNSAGRHSPNQPVQPLNSRKRRRRTNSGEITRNVAARRENSPEVRIKDEPISPQPPSGVLEAWRPPRKEEVHRPVHIDTTTPRQRPVERIAHPPRRNHDLGPGIFSDTAGPMTPANNGGGRFVEVRQDPDLRPLGSAKQVRAPPSPVEQYSGLNPFSTQGVSQVYLPRASQDSSQQYRKSVQPLPRYGPDRSPSPTLHHMPRSPPQRQGSVVMAPPSRRIVVDQYGNRFIEAPVLPERQMSIVPLGRPNDYDSRYEPARATSVRNPSFEQQAETRYVQRASSPASPRYIEYAPPSRTRSLISENDRYREGAYPPPNDSVRVVRYPESRMGRFEEMSRPGEAVTRMSSVRPVGYEMPREPIVRMQSVRPERDRIIDLSGRRETMPQPVRQLSVRPEEMYVRQAEPVEERSRYQYAPEPERRYFTDGTYDERVVFESARDPIRRVLS